MTALLACCCSTVTGEAGGLDGGEDVRLTLRHAERSSCGWGRARDNASVTGAPLQIGSRAFRYGIGTHAPAELVFAVGGKYRWVTFHAGISAEMTASGSAVVQVWADGKKLDETPVLRIDGEPVLVCVPIAGAKTLRLVGTDAGNGNGADHINLGHLRLCVGEARPKPDPPAKAKGRPKALVRAQAPKTLHIEIPRTRPIRHDELPARGASTVRPAAHWTEAFLTGNGRMGLMMFGRPYDETIVLNHCRLFLPRGSREIVPDLAALQDEVRSIGLEGGPGDAHRFLVAKAKEKGSGALIHTDPFHPAFLLDLEAPSPPGGARDLLMTEDFLTGEVQVRWADARGTWRRRAFVSRPSNAAAIDVDGPKGQVSVDLTIGIDHELVAPEISAQAGWLTAHTVYVKGKGGYDSVIRVLPRGGEMTCANGHISVTGADGVLVLIRVQPWMAPLPAEVSEAWEYSPKHPRYARGHKTNLIADIKAALSKLPSSYDDLLARHARIHGEMMGRASLDLNGGADRKVPTHKLLARAVETGRLSAALMERMYDACRYLMICSSGEVVPNLQGIWTGTWSPAWSGDWTLDSNIQLEIQSMMSANLPEFMDAYFRLVESWLPDCRTNARKLYGCRGIVTNARASNTCLLLHWGHWPGELYISGAGWLAHYFHEYYLYTGDREFLRKRLVPLLKEIALFYEDLLAGSEGPDGTYRFFLSYSPELATGLPNATIDIAIAREVLTNLIGACELLGIERDSLPKWRKMLAKMPPYLIGKDGALKEWSCPQAVNGRNYNHRHYSLMYPVYLSCEIDPVATPDLWKAAGVVLEKKAEHWLRGPRPNSNNITHGMMNHAQSAARLGRGDHVHEVLSRMATRRYLFDSFMISYWPDRKGFGFDAVGTIPDVVNNSLASSLRGELQLLPTLPDVWPKGAVRGILARGGLHIRRLAWDVEVGRIDLELTSRLKQDLTVSLPAHLPIRSLEIVQGDAAVARATPNRNGRTLNLPAEGPVRVEIRFASPRKTGR